MFHALANRTRRALVSRLAAGPAMVTALAEPFDMSLPSVSKHLRVLERAGLVARTVEGRAHWCALTADPLADAEAWLERYRGFWEGNLDALAAYVQDEP